MYNEIFYPNLLTKEEVEKLEGWKLKIAILHFGIRRKECINLNYGYSFIKNNMQSDRETIHLVASEGKILDKPIDLSDEIDWDNLIDLFTEFGINYLNLLKNLLKEKVCEITK